MSTTTPPTAPPALSVNSWSDATLALADISQDPHFKVWMRTAGLPTFRKLYGKNMDNILEKGQWEIDIVSSKYN